MTRPIDAPRIYPERDVVEAIVDESDALWSSVVDGLVFHRKENSDVSAIVDAVGSLRLAILALTAAVVRADGGSRP